MGGDMSRLDLRNCPDQGEKAEWQRLACSYPSVSRKKSATLLTKQMGCQADLESYDEFDGRVLTPSLHCTLTCILTVDMIQLEGTAERYSLKANATLTKLRWSNK